MDGHHAAILCQSALQTCIRSREMVRNLHWHTKMQWNEHNIAMLPWRCHLQGQCSWIPFFLLGRYFILFKYEIIMENRFRNFLREDPSTNSRPLCFFLQAPNPFPHPLPRPPFSPPPPPQLKWNRLHHPWLATVDTKKPRFIINCKVNS